MAAQAELGSVADCFENYEFFCTGQRSGGAGVLPFKKELLLVTLLMADD